MEFLYSNSNKLFYRETEIYPILLQLLHCQRNSDFEIIEVFICVGTNKYLCDKVTINTTLKTAHVMTSDITYNLSNIYSLKELKFYFTKETYQITNDRDKFYETSILDFFQKNCMSEQNVFKKLNDNNLKKNNTNHKKVENLNNKKEKNTVSLSNEINGLKSQIKSNENKLIEKVKFRDEIDKEKNPSWKHDFIDEEDNPKSENEYTYDYNSPDSSNSSNSSDFNSYSDSTSDSESENSKSTSRSNPLDESINEDTEEIQKEIEFLEKLKNETTEILKSELDKIDEDKNNLSKYHCLITEQEFNEKREKDRLEQEYNKFVSERDHTYGLIYDKFFNKKQIDGWECVPPFFMLKFPIYLYLDGKNTDGVDVRDKILGTYDDFRMYKLLYNSIVYDDFEFPEDETDVKIITDFLETFPPVPIRTEEDMSNLIFQNFDITKKNKVLFEEDMISQYSNSENDEDDRISQD